MSQLPVEVRKRVREVIASFRVLEEGAPSVLSTLPETLRALISAEHTATYGLVLTEEHPSLEFFHASRDARAQSFAGSFRQWLATAPMRFGYYNPVEPEEWQRDKPLRLQTIRERLGSAPVPLYSEFLPRWGLDRHDSVRALLCEGSSLLAWVGAFRPEPFGARDQAIMNAVVPPLRTRILLERRMGLTTFYAAALEAVMDQLSAPAFVLDRASNVMHANAAGRALLKLDYVGTQRELRESRAVHGGTAEYLIAPFRVVGITDHCIAVRRALPGAARDLTRHVRHWKLTPRQAQALQLLARGLSNRAIAAELGCSERTSALHVAAILQKAGTASRSELLARLLAAEG